VDKPLFKTPRIPRLPRITRRVLLGICIVNGISALICGPLMFLAPDGSIMGMQLLIPEMQSWPFADVFFQDLFWPGIALMLVVGVSNLVGAILLLQKRNSQYGAGALCGILLIAWTIWELIFMPNVVSAFYLLVAIVQTAAALYCAHASSQESGD
jgi:hypothetical protein